MDKYRKCIIAGLVAASLVPQALKLFVPTGKMLFAFFPDDCFYYYKTALNIAAGNGSTFDGINFTNGYHPLWMLVCVAIAHITSEPMVYLYSMLVVNLFVVLILSIRIVSLFKDRLGPWLAILVVVMMNGQRKCAAGVFSGLETPLYIWLVLEITNLLVTMSWHKRSDALALGLLGGLAFLTRTSFVLFVPAACLYLLYRYKCTKDRPAWQQAMLVVIPGLLLAVPYLAWNYYHTGYFQQISGVTKNLILTGGFASWAVFRQTLFSFASTSGLVLLPLPLSVSLVALLAVSIIVLWRYHRLRAPWEDARLAILTLFAATEGLYYFANYGPSTFFWHVAIINVVTFLLIACFARAAISCLSERVLIRRIITGLAILAGAICPWQSIYFYNVYHYSPIMYDAAIWMRTNLPQDARIGVWNAGVISYFSQRTVINLDGVINGTELYEYQRRGAIYEYITDHNIQYIADVYTTSPGPEHSVIKDRLRRVYVGEDRIQDARGHPAVARYYIWKIE